VGRSGPGDDDGRGTRGAEVRGKAVVVVAVAGFVAGFVAFPVLALYALKRDERRGDEAEGWHAYGVGSDCRSDIHNQREAERCKSKR